MLMPRLLALLAVMLTVSTLLGTRVDTGVPVALVDQLPAVFQAVLLAPVQ